MASTRTRTRRITSASKDEIKPATVSTSKPKPAPRTKPRIEDTEPSKSARKLVNNGGGTITPLGNGEAQVAAQMSETVPVAQYANVVLGPVQINWKLSNIDMEALVDVDWNSDDPLTKEQQVAYDRARGAVAATMRVLEDVLSSERALVEESVRMHNQKTEEETKSRARK